MGAFQAQPRALKVSPGGGRYAYVRFCVLLLLVGFLAPGCSRPAAVVLGTTTEADLKRQMGEPSSVEVHGARSIYRYGRQESFQVDAGVVRGRYREPSDAESNINYWRTRWAGQAKTYQAHESGHSRLLEIQDVETGSSIIYDPGARAVVRVMEFRR